MNDVFSETGHEENLMGYISFDYRDKDDIFAPPRKKRKETTDYVVLSSVQSEVAHGSLGSSSSSHTANFRN